MTTHKAQYVTAEASVPAVSRAVFERTPSALRYSTLGAYLAAFLTGAAAVVIFQNVTAKESLHFSTTEVISFLFGVALSGASIVLAVAAIALGKASEQAMIERSDTSIRLQNEVFVRTTEALARIESSTGVTEKRIEDIISGRAGELSHDIAERISTGRSHRGTTKEQLEQEIRESLMRGIISRPYELTGADVVERDRAKLVEMNYRGFQNSVLTGIVNAGGIECEKIGDGSFGGEGHGLFDGVFRSGEGLVGVSTFSANEPLAKNHVSGFRDFVTAAIKQIGSGKYARVIVAFDRALSKEGAYTAILDELKGVLIPELLSRFVVVDGDREESIARIVAVLREKSPEPSARLHAS
jgi:hypothetical protein